MGTDESGDATSVRVALRIRPQTGIEMSERCSDCIVCVPNEPQVVIGKDRAFTYDYVFPSAASQDDVFRTCITPIINWYVRAGGIRIRAFRARAR